eukprot:NODE_15160_length_1065_cov_2.877399.p1 GENE.NODE_15160_length_1065_cov_2.877399~~NODE_15160_length_1065_cov_2.877399.p1  ORF type:complete len:197 (+),score=53.29 NODE_15160_length_1065_cov_2.877399:115-705(+)
MLLAPPLRCGGAAARLSAAVGVRRHAAAPAAPAWAAALATRPGLRRVDFKDVLLGGYPDACMRRHLVYGTLREEMDFDAVYYEEAQRALWTVARLGAGLRNVQGTLHGGALVTAFDCTFGTLFTLSGYTGFTANVTTDFRRPVMLPAALLVRTHVVSAEGRKVRMAASLQCGAVDAPLVYAEGSALFISKRPTSTA